MLFDDEITDTDESKISPFSFLSSMKSKTPESIDEVFKDVTDILPTWLFDAEVVETDELNSMNSSTEEEGSSSSESPENKDGVSVEITDILPPSLFDVGRETDEDADCVLFWSSPSWSLCK